MVSLLNYNKKGAKHIRKSQRLHKFLNKKTGGQINYNRAISKRQHNWIRLRYWREWKGRYWRGRGRLTSTTSSYKKIRSSLRLYAGCRMQTKISRRMSRLWKNLSRIRVFSRRKEMVRWLITIHNKA